MNKPKFEFSNFTNKSTKLRITGLDQPDRNSELK